MSEQHEHHSDQGDTEAHLYIPKDERAGAAADTEAHGRFRGVEDAGEDDTISDTEGHMPFRRRFDDAGEDDQIGDVEGHLTTTSGDAVDEPSAVRGHDAQGRR
jgi:hypothetical protein